MKRTLAFDPGRAAVLLIDLQEEHRQDPRYLVDGYEIILGNAARLTWTARERGIPVVHSAYIVDTASGDTRPFHPCNPDGSSAFSGLGDPHSKISPEVAPTAEELVIIKEDASTFSRAEVHRALQDRCIEWLVVAGVWTEACIAATVKDAVDLGYRVLLVKDACGSGGMAMHQTGIINIANRLYGGAVIDTDRACKAMEGHPTEAWQVQGSVPLRFTYANAAEIYDAF